jgi:hypothetical protein
MADSAANPNSSKNKAERRTEPRITANAMASDAKAQNETIIAAQCVVYIIYLFTSFPTAGGSLP